MGRSTKRTSGGAVTEAPAKRKRRRKARTDVSSSSESSSSESDSSSGEDEVAQEKRKGPAVAPEDVEMKDADVASSSDEEEDQAAADSSHTEKSGRIPPQLRNFHDPLAASRFEEYYLNLVTQEFGDDLYSIRDAKDFDPARSMPMLVRALKQGVNIFDPDEKRMLISGLSKDE